MRRERAVILVILALAAAAYAPHLDRPFVFDDEVKIAKNPQLGDWRQPFRALAAGGYQEDASRLIPALTLRADHALFGTRPWGYHLSQLLLHLLNVVLVYRLLTSSGEVHLAALAAAIFALHPLQSEAVSYGNARPNLLVTTFVLLAVSAVPPAGGWSGRRVAAVGLSCLGALLSKEAGAVVVPLVLAAAWARGERRVLAAGAGLVAAAIAVLLASGALGEAGRALVAQGARAVVAQGEVGLRYLVLFLLPWPGFLSVDHALEPRAGALGVVGLAVQLGAAAWALTRLRARGSLALAVLWVVVAALPGTLFPRREAMVEYRTYLPMVGLSWLLARALGPLGRSAQAAVLALLVIATAARARVWRSELALWEDAARKAPASARIRQNLGVALARAGRFGAARAELERAARGGAADAGLLVNLGNLALEARDLEAGEALLRLAVARAPALPEAHNGLGSARLLAGRPQEAEASFREALRLRPGFARAWFNLALALARQGRREEAAAALDEAIRLDPALARRAAPRAP